MLFVEASSVYASIKHVSPAHYGSLVSPSHYGSSVSPAHYKSLTTQCFGPNDMLNLHDRINWFLCHVNQLKTTISTAGQKWGIKMSIYLLFIII